jgi:hypothetical protein
MQPSHVLRAWVTRGGGFAHDLKAVTESKVHTRALPPFRGLDILAVAIERNKAPVSGHL